MRFKSLLFLASISLLLFYCKGDTKANETMVSQTKDTLKNINELTFLETYYVVFKDKTGGMDAHGDLYGQEAISYLKIEIDSENSNCGDKLVLTSTASTEVDVAIKANFQLEDNSTKEFIRAYKIKPTEKIAIGTSIVCYNGKEYQITREIISAGFNNGKTTNH